MVMFNELSLECFHKNHPSNDCYSFGERERERVRP